MRELTKKGKEATNLDLWTDFRTVAERFDRQRIASESGLAFLFTEGALVDAICCASMQLLHALLASRVVLGWQGLCIMSKQNDMDRV